MSAAAQQVVTFRLGPDRFAADVAAVERVLRYPGADDAPEPARRGWTGVIDYHRRVVPVVDLRSRFGLPAAARRVRSRGSSSSPSARNGSA